MASTEPKRTDDGTDNFIRMCYHISVCRRRAKTHRTRTASPGRKARKYAVALRSHHGAYQIIPPTTLTLLLGTVAGGRPRHRCRTYCPVEIESVETTKLYRSNSFHLLIFYYFR